VDEGAAHFCAGIFPDQGVFHVAADAKTGKKLAEAPADASAQGYMEHRAGQLYLSTGRDPAGAFVAALKKRVKTLGREVGSIPELYPYGFIAAGDLRFAGGEGKVAAFSGEDGRELWTAAVEGRAWSLAVSQGRLLVGTDRGFLYAFSAGAAEPVVHEPPAPAPPGEAKEADWFLEKTGLRSGYALVLGSGEGSLVAELARKTEFRVVGVEPDPAKVARSRKALAEAGLYGRAVVHALRPDGELPYTDYLFNLVVVEGAARRDEVMRVTRPEGGAAVFLRSSREVVRREALEGTGEWTHMYADPSNTACSGDRRVSGEMRLQWFGLPGPEGMVDRHHRTVPPLWKSGRIFIPGNERIYGLDAYNGAVLWEAEVQGSRRVAVFRDCGSMAAAAEALYVAATDKCVALDPETGKVKSSLPAPAGKEWGYVAVAGDLLVGSATKPGACRRDHSRRVPEKESFYDFVPLVGSDALFAVDRKSGELRWSYAARGLVANSTIAIGGGKAFFVESADAKTLEAAGGRALLSDLVGKGSSLVALDLKTGKPAWSVAADLGAIQQALYVLHAQDRVVIVGTRNSGTGKSATVHYDAHVHSAANGRREWTATLDYGAAVNGEHGEQDHHPVAMGDRLFVEPKAYDLRSGKVLDDWGWKPRRGCGTLSASASTLFFRNQTACMMDPATKQVKRVAAVTRPGCWINMIPAGGLLLMPEASSGCSCNFAVQTSIAYLPSGKAGR
jgi:outer membrane protein assembly factor BamB